MGLASTRTAGFWPPLMVTRPTPGSWAIFWARVVSAKSSTLCRGMAVGGERQRQNRRVGGIHLAVDRRIGQIRRQERAAGIDGGLHLLLGHVNVLIEIKLQNDQRGAEGARRGHLLQTWHLPELPFQRRGHRRHHYARTSARIEREHLNRGVIHLGQAPRPAAAYRRQARQARCPPSKEWWRPAEE